MGSPSERDAGARESEAGSKSRRDRPRLLVLDDEVALAATLRKLLEHEFDVVSVTSVRDALASVENGPRFDLALSDLILPGLDGIAFYERLLEVDPRLRERLVFMTGGAFTATARAFLERSKIPTIAKPFDPDDLRVVLLRILDARNADQPGT